MPAKRAEPASLFLERLRSGPPLVLDAALGTELTRRGADTSPPLWSARALLSRPGLVEWIHAENAAAGAEILTADTFRTHPRTVGDRARELTALAVRLARQGAVRGRKALAGGPSPFVAGSLSPLADCYRPDLVPPDAALEREHSLQANALAAAGADLLLLETFNCVREWRAAARAAAATGLPVLACAVTDGAGRLLSGEPVEKAVRALLDGPFPPAAIGVNCVPARRMAAELARVAREAPGVPLVAYGNTGVPVDTRGESFSEPIDPDAYAAQAETWIALGARVVGGCCGTRAGHTAALRALVERLYGK